MHTSFPLRLNIPTEVLFGCDATAHFQLPPGDVILVISPSLHDSILDPINKVLSTHSGIVTRVFKPSGEPSSGDVDNVFAKLDSFNSVLAIGGGSTLDFAKAIALLGGSGGKIAEYEFGIRKVKEIKPLYLSPTTAGTGSEVTPYTVINNSDTGRKFTLSHQSLRATQAAIDPTVLERLPKDVILSTAIDAFTHCLESLLTTASTQLIWPIAMEGLKIAWELLPLQGCLVHESDYYEKLARMSLFGGISIAHSRTGLIHTSSVAFAQFSKEPHGILNGLLLPFAIKHCLNNYNGLLRRVISEASGEIVSSDLEAYGIIVSWIKSFMDLGFPMAPELIAQNKESIVSRILQDRQLSLVCHGDVSENGIKSLIEGIYHA